jgi:hypothetical protein
MAYDILELLDHTHVLGDYENTLILLMDIIERKARAHNDLLQCPCVPIVVDDDVSNISILRAGGVERLALLNVEVTINLCQRTRGLYLKASSTVITDMV